jgi:hypothetical protein
MPKTTITEILDALDNMRRITMTSSGGPEVKEIDRQLAELKMRLLRDYGHLRRGSVIKD